MGIEENLISAVFLRPFIYDLADPNHGRKKLVNKAWTEIAQECESTDEVCRSKWKNLRDTFYRQKKKQPSGSGLASDNTWVWMKSLSFLANYKHPRKTIENVVAPVSDMPVDSSPESADSFTCNLVNPSQNPSSGSTMPSSRSTVAHEAASRVLANAGVSKKRGKESLASQWGAVVEKFNSLADIGEDQETIPSSFGKFIAAEMKELSPNEQEDFKWEVMSVLRTIKRARKDD